jgi:hypothetical protein
MAPSPGARKCTEVTTPSCMLRHMADAQQSAHEAFTAILTQPAGLARLTAALPRITFAVLFAPKPFFRAIGTADRLSVLNAFGFFVVAVTLYVVALVVFDEWLIHIAGYAQQPLVSFYAESFAHDGIPLAHALGFLAVLGSVTAQSLFALAESTVFIWFIATAFIHTGKVASPKAMLVAGLYATGAIALVLGVVSLPASYFDGTFNPGASLATLDTLLYDLTRFATAAGLQTKYEIAFYYLYLRSVSFTTDLRLHWGLVFTILLAAVAVFVMRAL